jgi:putative glutamine amidotransferase
MRPVIGITAAFDSEQGDSLLPGVNLYYVNTEYAAAVEAAGGIPVLVPCIKESGLRRELLNFFLDGLIITGGVRDLPERFLERPELPGLEEQNPLRYVSDAQLIRDALLLGMPVLGICRGHQMINEVTGGKLSLSTPEKGSHRQTRPSGEPWHEINISPGSLVHRITGKTRLAVNSLHLQAVKEPGAGMTASCWADDGVIEAIECPGREFLLGLQFHPERMISNPVYLKFFEYLVKCAGRYRNSKKMN